MVNPQTNSSLETSVCLFFSWKNKASTKFPSFQSTPPAAKEHNA